MLVFLNVNYRNIIKISLLVMAPRNAEHILAQLLRSKSILNHELFRKRTEYTGVSFYPVSILNMFPQGRRRCKDIIRLGRITMKLKAKPDLG